METALPALILFLVVLGRLYVLALKQPKETAAVRVACRLHQWERSDGGLVCKACGMQPAAD